MVKKFKLQSVLNYRTTLEEQAQQALALSQQQQQELMAAIARQQQELNDQDQELKQRQREGLTIAEINIYESRINHCRHRSAQLQAQFATLEKKIVKQREALLQAARDRQVMDKLKERQEAEFRREQERKERIQLDEISLRSKGTTP
ncbi:flagellar export protein FliJ [Pelovirga terrestris]|uniref:Flagellar FliJ protein n=1 Tax=Pelovirga terrestris TaxID=2771352 RepID=A0A8J6QX19_9BACT|nr:flagellar export protein FliJ [Pelovirga terrestris]MBD1400428.1 flagellar export protein FliJ [Pelovirga terrestris]